MRKSLNEKGLGIIDAIVVCLLIAIVFGILIPRYHRLARHAEETELRVGLTNMRTAIQLYTLLNGSPPNNLKELLEKRYLIPTREGTIFTEQYLRTLALDNEGYPVDPFGNSYSYKPKEGMVSSTTKGYERW